MKPPASGKTLQIEIPGSRFFVRRSASCFECWVNIGVPATIRPLTRSFVAAATAASKSAGAREALDEPSGDRITGGGHHHDRDRRGRLSGGLKRCRPPGRKNDIHRQVDEFRRQTRKSLEPILGKSTLDDDILTLDPAELAKPPEKGAGDVRGRGGTRTWRQNSDPRNLCRPLPLGGERRDEEAASQHAEERSSVHYRALTWPRRLGGTGQAASSDLTTAG